MVRRFYRFTDENLVTVLVRPEHIMCVTVKDAGQQDPYRPLVNLRVDFPDGSGDVVTVRVPLTEDTTGSVNAHWNAQVAATSLDRFLTMLEAGE